MVCTWFWKGTGSPLQEAILRHQQGIQEFNSILILPCFPKNNTPPWVRSQMCSDHSFSALRQLIVCLVGLQIMRLIWNIFISFHLKHWKYCLCKSLQISSFASCWEVFLPSPPQHPLFLSFLTVWFKGYLLLGGPLTASFIIMVKLSAYSLLIFSPCQCGPQWSFMQPWDPEQDPAPSRSIIHIC